ncbi:MAG: SEC-C metal-binding domain-containing protein [Desulfosporosinus sp.]|nr:SEC-C metal-binding domain-containing protein [Desulfosporosinus sp.]
MDTQSIQLNSQAGRNDPCPCGSGKKYKKCCLSKDEEKEQLKQELENIKDVTDEFFTTKEYIEESGYPVTMFDHLLLEMLNIIGEILHEYHKFRTLDMTH